MGAISMRSSSFVLCGVLALSFSACKSTSGSGAAKEDLALVPKETDIVLMANVSRMRNTAMWRKLLDVRDSDPQSKKDYDDFVAKCALDPFKQIDSIFVAFPQTGAAEKEFAAILRGTFNEQKLVQCAKDQAKKDGRDVTITDYNGKKLYTDNQKAEAWATFLDGKTVVVGGKEWVKKVVDLAAGKGAESAKANAELATLLKRAKTSDALWGAGIVPQSTRDSFKNDPRLSSAASMKDIFGSVDFASGVTSELNVDTGSEADAKDLASKATAQLTDIRKSPQFMMMGLAQYLDGIKIDSKAATFQLHINYNQQQVDDLINRVKGLLKSFGGAMGGMPMAPPSQ
ncbi:MAG: hypothetical protein JWM53_2182 [bacterium]|nr:hypothetical protein [bacterium]